jgi:hypothetical protein
MSTARTGRRALSCATALAASAIGAVVACGSGDLVVGDDSRDAAMPTLDSSSPEPDAQQPATKDGSTTDAKSGAPPGFCAAAPGGPGMCLPPGSACRQADTSGLTCPTAGQFCCVMTCPELAQPAPGFCDGGPYAPLYDSKACIVGFACTPVACSTAGGMCVGLAPGSCPNNNFGDATKYSCGGGIGAGCCLP